MNVLELILILWFLSGFIWLFYNDQIYIEKNRSRNDLLREIRLDVACIKQQLAKPQYVENKVVVV